ncbi:hypothetical protein [Micromonospora sp. NPDC047134]|uniref:hypothetical protein n=1 Tax=Micromonospora sp. NPDC047134 TaxID=3154340 RepID=UPI0033CD5832
MKVLRQGPERLTLAEARERVNGLQSGKLRGTKVEMELLADSLRNAGVEVNVESTDKEH